MHFPKAFLPLLLLILSFVQSAPARLGETLEALKVRYGEPKTNSVDKLTGLPVYTFEKDSWHTEAILLNDKCAEEYHFPGDGEAATRPGQITLAEDISATTESDWAKLPPPRMAKDAAAGLPKSEWYHTRDGAQITILETGGVSVMSAELIQYQREVAQKRAQEAEPETSTKTE